MSLEAELRAQQNELAQQLRVEPFEGEIQTIAGCDSSFLPDDRILSVFVVLEYPSLEQIEARYHVDDVELPYIPGLLAFREMPNVLKAYESLEHEPDLIFVDGHGISHPRRMGIATHLGITLDKPTIGIAKKRLTGRYDEPSEEPGSWTELTYRKEVLGRVLRTRKRANPIFISVGHRVTLEQAFELTQDTQTKYRLPEPTRIADALSKEFKKEIL